MPSTSAASRVPRCWPPMARPWRRCGSNMPGPLEGVRIIDLTTVLMGPYATVMLGDMGADVIQVEPPQGDLVRSLGPGRHADMGAIFMHANRSKRRAEERRVGKECVSTCRSGGSAYH